MKEEKLLGFGCMRLPMKDAEVDLEEFTKMVDYAMENGFNYFDTAHGYIGGKSEIAIRECLTKRYKREEYLLTDKLTSNYFSKEEDIRPFFEEQLKICGVDYFDYYLLHALDRDNYNHYKKTRAFEIASELKKEGKIKHLGISFHDTADVLEEILNDHPEIEIVQIQFNYADYDSPSVQSKKVYDVTRKYNKPVLIMEPVKGGKLANLPNEAKSILDELNGGSNASYAIRFAASFEGVYKVLSGMSNMEQIEDNISFMKNFVPLDDKEKEALQKVTDILNKKGGIPCTACRYCTSGCPMQIQIPDLFSCYNAKEIYNDWNSGMYYSNLTAKGGKASSCIKCHQCESVCPQHLEITSLLEKVAEKFE